ncbi:MAG: AAA family ATPase [Alphaproteobacteria bacterium]
MEDAELPSGKPDIQLSLSQVFSINSDLHVPAFSERTSLVPEVDSSYKFDQDTTLAILSGFNHDRRVMVQGHHGTGKSTHIEQVAARLNWPCVRINFDGHISRVDLIGRDAIVLREGKQVTEFREGLLPWCLQRPVALVFDEYDAGRADVMFVVQRILEQEGKLTLLDQNRVITPNPYFRLFATANTIGLGDTSGLYHGTQQINQGQMDRWNVIVGLNYLEPHVEEEIVLARTQELDTPEGRELIHNMVALAGLTRQALMTGDISTVMSPRTVITWAENTRIFGNTELAFTLAFLNRCDEAERRTIAECYQRCFGRDPLRRSPSDTATNEAGLEDGNS